MAASPQTFEIRTSRPERVVETASRRSRDSSGAGLLFVSGALSAHCLEIAQDLALEAPDSTWLVIPAAGVLTERGEIERDSAATGIIIGASLETLTSTRAEPQFGEILRNQLDSAPGSSAILLIRGDRQDSGWLTSLKLEAQGESPRIFGGGTLPNLDIHFVKEGIVSSGGAVAVILRRSRFARLSASSACRLLSPLGIVTRARGPMLHEIDGQPALERLGHATATMTEHPLILLAMAAGANPLAPEGRSLALRPIQGVDPSRGSLILQDEVPEGSRVAFAVRDAHSARTDLDAHLRSLARGCAGTEPEFGIYFNCAGRASALYKSPDVDVRLIRSQFPQMPFVGMHSTFELAPLGGEVVPQIYSGVLGVFCRPS